MEQTLFTDARILIVDDSEANIDVLLGMLEMEGYSQIKTLTDSRKVISTYEKFQPDIILLDLMMPYFDGFDILRMLRKIIPANTYLPILVLTADISTESRQKALAQGAFDFVSKPFDIIEVSLRIKNLLFTRILYKRLDAQNLKLEDSVKKRTNELERINIVLSHAKEKAEASDRMKSAFINNITHEIRTPLTSIIGFSQLLSEEELDKEEKTDLFGIIKESSDRLINTVNDYLDVSILVSGNQEVNMKNFMLFPILENTLMKLNKLATTKGINIKVGPAIDTEIMIVSDPLLISKVIRELVENAIKFAKEGDITISYENNNDQLLFSVTDSGVGIEKEMQPWIFNAFTQESNANTRGYEGSGLGLTISKHIINLLGGTIGVDSVKNQGSTFYFSIPLEE
ncbi:MAG: ATP-binding protein [Bacteroidales bacterium]